MRANIDLTSNRMFEGREDSNKVRALVEKRVRYGKINSWSTKLFPWNSYAINLSSNYSNIKVSSLIPLGSKRDIGLAKELYKSCSDRYCDRCGKRLRIKPWGVEYQYRLCRHCQDELDSKDKFLWNL